MDGRVAVVSGVPALHAAAIKAVDLRAGAAVVIAALKMCIRDRWGTCPRLSPGFPCSPVPAPGVGLGHGQELKICTAGRAESLESRPAGGAVGDLPPPVAWFPLPPVPAPGMGLGGKDKS